MRFIFLFFTLTLICCQEKKSSIVGSEKESHKAAVKFINDYSSNLANNVDYDYYAWLEQRTTKEFVKALKQMIKSAPEDYPELGALPFDPILLAQEVSDEPYIVESFDDDSNYLIVKNLQGHFRIRMKMKFVQNKWLVDGSGIVNIPDDKIID